MGHKKQQTSVRIERPSSAPREQHDHAFESFDDLKAHTEVLEKGMNRAQEMIDAYARGLSPAETEQFRRELPVRIRNHRFLLQAQLEDNGAITKMDMSDWSYDNAPTDNALRLQLGKLRDMNTDLNQLYGTRTVRKVTAALTEDLPNWFGVRFRQLKDVLTQGLIGTAAVGGLTAAGLLAGYSIYAGGITPGLQLLLSHATPVVNTIGGHLNTIGGYLATGASTVMTGLSGLKDRIFGTAVAAPTVDPAAR